MNSWGEGGGHRGCRLLSLHPPPTLPCTVWGCANKKKFLTSESLLQITVLDPKKGVCADPVDRAAILGRGGPDPHSRDRERQLTPDGGSGRT
jgi:hypothetical protein